MPIVEGAVGGLLAALITLFVTERLKALSERQTAVIGLATELAHNLSVTADILDWNVKALRSTSDSQAWWELVAFSDACWIAVVSGGLLPRLRPGVVESSARAYAELKKADYSAGKLQYGRVYWRKAVEYTIRVFDAGEAVSNALLAMTAEKKYEKMLASIGQVDTALSRWKQDVREWRREVDRTRSEFRAGEDSGSKPVHNQCVESDG